VEGSCEHGNGPSGSIKRWEVLEWLHNWRLLKKGSASWVSDIANLLNQRDYISTSSYPVVTFCVEIYPLKYCDTTPERRKCAVREALQRRQLLNNGSLGTYPRERIGLWKPKRYYEINTRFYGDVDSWRQTWYGMRLPCQRTSNKRSPRMQGAV
jgi:hypothetical protein